MCPPRESLMVLLFQLISGGKFLEQEALVSPISSAKLSNLDFFVFPKFLLLDKKSSYDILICLLSNPVGYIKTIFTKWNVC